MIYEWSELKLQILFGVLQLPWFPRFFFEFVETNQQNVAQEVRSEYVDTMSKIYYSYFKSYSSRLAKLRYEEAATKDDLMGIVDMGASRGSGLFYKTPLKHKSTVFTIGSRGDVLSAQLEAPIIVPHAAHKTEHRVSVTACKDTLHAQLEACIIVAHATHKTDHRVFVTVLRYAERRAGRWNKAQPDGM